MKKTRNQASENEAFTDRAERIKWCPHREYQIPLLCCPRCDRFPCRGMKAQDMDDLEHSLFTEQRFVGFMERRSRMYILKTEDGMLHPAPDDFSPDKASGKELENIIEVYVVSKTLVKQVKLVVKDKTEIAAIRNAKAQAPSKNRRIYGS